MARRPFQDAPLKQEGLYHPLLRYTGGGKITNEINYFGKCVAVWLNIFPHIAYVRTAMTDIIFYRLFIIIFSFKHV